MNLLQTAGVFVAQALWRATGFRPAGQYLVKILGSKDETARTVAGIFLVRAGHRSEPLLEAALKQRQGLPMVLAVLADIGNLKYEQDLRQFTDDNDPQIARAAKNALRALAAHR